MSHVIPKDSQIYLESKKANNILKYSKNWVEDEMLRTCISAGLPENYDFEIGKTINRIVELKASRPEEDLEKEFTVYLQMPEGLLIFSDALSSIIEHFAKVNVVILGDITYGGCCIEDQLMRCIEMAHCSDMNSSLLVHYAHSCLIPMDELTTYQCPDIPNILYVFVEIHLSIQHFVNTVKQNFHKKTKLSLLSTIQFHSTIINGTTELNEHFSSPVEILSCDPLALGETLGCTSAILPDYIDVCIFVSDGRFHLESAMMQNPHVEFYRYDPFSKKITLEKFNHILLHENRKSAIKSSFNIIKEKSKSVGHNFVNIALLFSTLGRQGSFAIKERLQVLVDEHNNKTVELLPLHLSTMMLSDLSTEYINGKVLSGVDLAIQLGCPRLSTDWGLYYDKPILNSYEGFILLGNLSKGNYEYLLTFQSLSSKENPKFLYREIYPMNYWAMKGDIWCNYYAGESRNGTYTSTTEQKQINREKMRRQKLKLLNLKKIDVKYDS
ncbi:putative diphthamide synthesis protein [Cryptosporidium muris RN66]|uniref:2-(3-amino-3-carboxypropyl)histidine synthase subunit 1 n=1 Tax=Cryptosporidium muris (strain RN66) TaxID=441375 RepID=B6ADI3_CRYMR|nr:putative diphthamide synthesis protein [Cryptosporidium muris RN66]EEA06274.1 putative diphthamide synthesis protein [Cryptosporidium muris RN66]|eukprot:XP_002140623.1 diphthamide synthesis protein [Cryptosporidium muris RN66]